MSKYRDLALIFFGLWIVLKLIHFASVIIVRFAFFFGLAFLCYYVYLKMTEKK